MSPRVIDKEEKKAQILKAAMRVFAQNGVVKTKMADIAKASGIAISISPSRTAWR
jgi:AcrR family transcriptional regulator